MCLYILSILILGREGNLTFGRKFKDTETVMKTKIILAVALSACSASTLLHAGGMGAAKKPTPFLIPFLAGEGMYTWPQVDGYNIDLLNATVHCLGALHRFLEV